MRTAFRRHLRALLPLPNVSGEREANEVIPYAIRALERAGRNVLEDAHGNVVSQRGDAAIVAHTDSVDDDSFYRGRLDISERDGKLIHEAGLRPMGADDKVGVAIALTLAEGMTSLTVWLMADEELGLVGAEGLQAPPVELAIECDRQGAGEMVVWTHGLTLCDPVTATRAAMLLPHRKPVLGGETDVVALVRRGLAGCALNLACGYHHPHQRGEYVVLAEAEQALVDAHLLLSSLNVG